MIEHISWEVNSRSEGEVGRAVFSFDRGRISLERPIGEAYSYVSIAPCD